MVVTFYVVLTVLSLLLVLAHDPSTVTVSALHPGP